ncbi:Uncharacterized protein dnm_047700 [Desulfonema magnum]|uniref:Uncharacterized protein n=1 Tax=Desulfonema magnum TaxID=45655 RepID=A0A975GQ99_9BACT|nr:Uncharacterized protein dnm_047700 [Desulfonema magnum]
MPPDKCLNFRFSLFEIFSQLNSDFFIETKIIIIYYFFLSRKNDAMHKKSIL